MSITLINYSSGKFPTVLTDIRIISLRLYIIICHVSYYYDIT